MFKWASGLSLAAEQSIGRSQEAWIGRLYKVDFVREGHVQSGQVGFPLLLNKALAGVKKHGYGGFTSCTLLKKGCSEWASGLSLAAEQSIGRSQEAWIGRLYKVDFIREGHVQSGQVGFPLLLNKALAGVKKHGYGGFTSCTLLKKGCSEWASGLSLAAEQSIGRSQEAWIGRLYKVDFVKEGHVQSGQVGFPLLLNKALAGVKKHGLDDCTRWTL